MKRIDINCDLGEGFDDAALMPLITSANIACGGHAGDETSMRRAVRLAIQHGVNIGAHPSYEDRLNFGRVKLTVPLESLRQSVADQIGQLRDIVNAEGGTLRHVKPHGALYNEAIQNPDIAAAIMDGVWRVDPSLTVVTMPNSELYYQAHALCNPIVAECFADRTYQRDGTLTPRTDPRALHTREIDAVDQILWIVRDGCVRSVDGNWIPLEAQTVCVHGDGTQAVATLRMVRSALTAAGIEIRPF